MIRSLVITFLVLLTLPIFSQAQDGNKGRPSPPKVYETTAGGGKISIHYNAPSVKGREIWGKLVPYKKIWRTGANEATTFESDVDLLIEGQLLPKGKYALFTIPDKTEWTIIFHSNVNQWGVYEYKEEGDVLRVKVKPLQSTSFQEQLLFTSVPDGIAIVWENLSVPFTIKHSAK
jgi:hypothetical protein